jgi:CelD/BcsL family acetyltransferase involved in cellulose biosynthesis
LVEEQVCTQTQELDPALLQADVISDEARFNALEPEWDDLVERASIDHPFLSHTWLRTWWECFGKGQQLHVITVRAGGKLIAAAPMMRTKMRMFGLNVDTLTSMYNPHTPRFDFLIAGEAPREITYKLIWRELSSAKSDMVVLRQVPQTSGTLAEIQRLAQDDQWSAGSWTARPSPYIPLACTHAELLGRLKGGYRYNLRKRQERLSKIGAIDVEVITDKAAALDAMRDGLRIEAAAWKGDQGTAILSDPDVTAFYMRLAERQADLGKLRLSFLRINGKRISFSFILHSHRVLYGVKIGYDPEYHTYSPGNMLLNLVLQEACEQGLQEYDFLGINDEWKFDWTKETRTHQWLFLFPNRLRARLLHCLKFSLIPKVKPCISRLGRLSALRTS